VEKQEMGNEKKKADENKNIKIMRKKERRKCKRGWGRKRGRRKERSIE
jgi:hypothetical protein